MKPTRFLLIACAIAACVAAPVLRADDPAPGEERLRSELRDTTLQLRAAQSDLATAQGLQATTAGERDAVAAKYEALKKQMVADEGASGKMSSDLQAQAAALKAENLKLADALSKARAEVERLTRASEDSSARGARLKSEAIVLNRKISDLETKNLSLFLTGNEILTRYQDFSLGNALTAKEPFVGSTRTRLENLIQDYHDKLSDQRSHD
jgi:chromosome segregation ATPase